MRKHAKRVLSDVWVWDFVFWGCPFSWRGDHVPFTEDSFLEGSGSGTEDQEDGTFDEDTFTSTTYPTDGLYSYSPTPVPSSRVSPPPPAPAPAPAPLDQSSGIALEAPDVIARSLQQVNAFLEVCGWGNHRGGGSCVVSLRVNVCEWRQPTCGLVG